MSKPDEDMINMRLHEIERAYYDPRADFLAAVALDDATSRTSEARLLRESTRIYSTARVVIRPGGNINVRQQVLNVLRRIGR